MSFRFQGLEAMRTWSEFGTAYSQMLMSANEVILRRTHHMATGMMTAPEATAMVMEKMTAMASATEMAALAVVKGGNPLTIATAALRPYGTKTKHNARRLRR